MIDPKHVHNNKKVITTAKGHFFRFFGWWAAFSGLIAMFAQCPFCGKPGCIVGPGVAGLFGSIGGFMYLYITKGKVIINNIFKKYISGKF